MSIPELEVQLDDISSCFEGIIPTPVATVGEDGTPNITFLSVVHRIDDRHVALSRQFFNKTDHNTVMNPHMQVIVVDPEDGRLFALDLKYVRTETDGPLFEKMRTKLDAVAAHEGMTNIFRLRGTDVCEVTRCRMLPSRAGVSTSRRNLNIEQVTEFSKELAAVGDMEELFEITLRACRELLGHPHAFIMLADESGDTLYTVAATGFPDPGTGSEVRLGEGLIGIAAARHESVRVTHMSRDLSYSRAAFARENSDGDGHGIPLPQLPSIQSQLVTPMLAHRQLVGVLCLQSEEPGRFRAVDECVVAILANQVAVALASLAPPDVAPASAGSPVEHEICTVRHYLSDDSVFIDNEYLIKGVPGAILWRLLRFYQEDGRSEFSNKELRLDASLELPDIKDNLEARLILLRKRLEERTCGLRIERTARGRFRLAVDRPLTLEEAP